jgi:hypothetical protein
VTLSRHPARASAAPLAGRGFTTDCVAFTIRAWSRRTSRFAVRQSMACQSADPWEVAQAVVLAFICLTSLVDLPSSLVFRDQVEVCTLSCRVLLLALNSYPLHYREAFAFSTLPCPQPRRLASRLAFLSFSKGRLRVFHVSHLNPDGLGPAYSPVALHLRQERFELLLLSTHHFGTSLYNSTFGLSLVTTFIGGLHLLAMPSNPSPRPPWC